MLARPRSRVTIQNVVDNAAKQRSPLEQLASRLSPLLWTRWSGYLFAVVTIAITTTVVALLMGRARLGNASTIYAIPVLATAALYGRGPALAASAAAFLAF